VGSTLHSDPSSVAGNCGGRTFFAQAIGVKPFNLPCPNLHSCFVLLSGGAALYTEFDYLQILYVAFLQQNVVILNDLLLRRVVMGKKMACEGGLTREWIRTKYLGVYKKSSSCTLTINGKLSFL